MPPVWTVRYLCGSFRRVVFPVSGERKMPVWGGLEKMTGYVASDDSLFSGRCWDILCGMTGCFLSGTVTFFFLFRAVCPLLIPFERGFLFVSLRKQLQIDFCKWMPGQGFRKICFIMLAECCFMWKNEKAEDEGFASSGGKEYPLPSLGRLRLCQNEQRLSFCLPGQSERTRDIS